MKKTIIITAIITLLASVIIVLSVFLHKKGKDLRQVKANYEAEILGLRDVQQTIGIRDLKEYFSSEVAQLKEHGIPARNVEHIIEVEYIYRDTTRYRDTLIYVYDTVRAARRADFCVSAGCFDIDGQIIGDTIEIASVTNFDNILVALYREKRKCLFERQRVRAIAISSCTGDTLSVIRNIKIER